MSDVVISVENLSKRYRLGTIGGHTLRQDYARWWARKRGKPDPYLRIGQTDYSNQEGENVWALRDVNLQVRQGEIVGIIGRNGAGKSTLLKILSRITAPTSGEVKIKGRIGALLEVGTGFHPELTGRENIYLNGAILGMTRAEVARKFDEIVDFSGVEQYIHTPVKRYSSGMHVRLAFAVAAHLEPEILVVDEVLAVGDVEFRRKSLGKMQDVAHSGRTVLFVSHNMAAVDALCHRTICLVDGRIGLEGPTREVTQDYVSGSRSLQQGSEPNGVDVARLDEQMGAPVAVTGIDILDLDGKSFKYGDLKTGLRVRIQYETRDSVVAPAFVVVLRSEHGVELFRLSTMPISGHYIDRIEGSGVVELILEDLPLTGGIYYFSIGITRANVEFFTYLEDIAWITIEPRDFYDSGMVLDTSKGYLVLPHRWQHSATDEYRQIAAAPNGSRPAL